MVEEVIAPVKRFESGVVTVNEMHSDRALRYTKKLKAIEDVIDVRWKASGYHSAKAVVVCCDFSLLCLIGTFFVGYKNKKRKNKFETSPSFQQSKIENIEYADLADREVPGFRYPYYSFYLRLFDFYPLWNLKNPCQRKWKHGFAQRKFVSSRMEDIYSIMSKHFSSSNRLLTTCMLTGLPSNLGTFSLYVSWASG